MKWQIVVEHGKRKGQSIAVSRLPFTIGRAPGCHLRPASACVSERHCRLVTYCGHLFVIDCRSPDGTFVNEDRITGRQELRPGDHLRVGPLTFLIAVAEATPSPARGPLDDDAIGDMLLAMDGEEDPLTSATPERSETGATIPESDCLSGRETRPNHPAVCPQQSHPRGEAVKAAGELLGDYVRRPRSGAGAGLAKP